jgi:hypothetical protein
LHPEVELKSSDVAVILGPREIAVDAQEPDVVLGVRSAQVQLDDVVKVTAAAELRCALCASVTLRPAQLDKKRGSDVTSNRTLSRSASVALCAPLLTPEFIAAQPAGRPVLMQSLRAVDNAAHDAVLGLGRCWLIAVVPALALSLPARITPLTRSARFANPSDVAATTEAVSD